MKSKIGIVVFLAALMAGYLSWAPFQSVTRKVTNTVIFDKTPELAVETPVINDRAEEKIDWIEEDASKFKIKLQEAGQGFHGNEVNAKSGEIWLGLFKEGDRFFLRDAKVTVKSAHDPVVDGDDNSLKTGKDVSVAGKYQPVFLLKNANILRSGEVKTLFLAEGEDRLELKNGFTAEYELNGKKYRLYVNGGINSSTLTLESEGIRQVLYHVDQMGDATWSLIWVGDLDRDGKLDFYADLNDFYNFMEPRLFLSSPAGKGKVIKQVAIFHISGC